MFERVTANGRLVWAPIALLAAAKLSLLFVVPDTHGLTSDWLGHAEYLPMFLAGFALGAGTALMGEKAAHACTEAVESVIEQHYAGQIAELSEQEPELAAQLSQFRDEELAHRDLAVEEGAHQAPGYAALSAVIRAGCRAAIKLSEKV